MRCIPMRKRILICGMGVIGSVYALRLAESGNEVTALARGRRLEALHAHGLRLSHAILKEGEETALIDVIDRLDQGADYDIVLIAVRSGQIRDALLNLRENMISARAIVVIGNNLDDLNQLSEITGKDTFVAGFGTFGGYEENGIIHYLDGRTPEKNEGKNRSKTTLGIIDPSARPALKNLLEVLNEAGLPTVESEDIPAWLLYHAALVLPLAGAIYAVGGDQEAFCQTRDAIVLGIRSCHECFRALKTLGYKIQPKSLQTMLLIPERSLAAILSKRLRQESARVAIFGHANSPTGRDELDGHAVTLNTLIQRSGESLPSWNRLYPYFDSQNKEPGIPVGSRDIRLKFW